MEKWQGERRNDKVRKADAPRRTRKTRPVWREKAMAKLDSWVTEHELPPGPFAKMKQAVIALFAQMALRGEFD